MNRRRPAAVLVASLLLLAGCAGLPTSGQVQPGLPATEETAIPDLSFVADPPQPGATPGEIVDGFIRAGSGPRDNWATARQFLAEPLATTWQPNAGVTVDLLTEREVVESDDLAESDEDAAVTDSQVVMELSPVATVDENGGYEASSGGMTSLTFTLELNSDGEWRITSAPDGIVLDDTQFPQVYHSYELAFFDPNWEYLVPDVRWFPSLYAETRIVETLIGAGPSAWLSASVATAFPEDVTVRPSVPVDDGVAEVELSENALSLETVTLDRMLTQLTESLASADVSRVQMDVGGSPITAETVSTVSTRVLAQPLVLTADGEFGFLTGDEIDPLEGLSGALAAVSNPVAIQTTPEQDAAAVRTRDGTVVRVGAGGTTLVLDERADLIDPTIGPAGWTWSVPAGSPSEVLAYDAEGSAVTIAGAWPSASRITAMEISRDGTRMAALVASGGRSALWLSGVVRDADGAPVALADPIVVESLTGTGVDISWLDETTVGTLVEDPDGDLVLREQLVGGTASDVTAPSGAVSIAGSNQVSTVRALTDDGLLLTRRGTNWQQLSEGILVLAVQQGSPR